MQCSRKNGASFPSLLRAPFRFLPESSFLRCSRRRFPSFPENPAVSVMNHSSPRLKIILNPIGTVHLMASHANPFALHAFILRQFRHKNNALFRYKAKSRIAGDPFCQAGKQLRQHFQRVRLFASRKMISRHMPVRRFRHISVIRP